MPDRIVIAFIPELRLYGFKDKNGPITELLKILEKGSRAGLELTRGFPNSDRIASQVEAVWIPGL